ncbi:hypothetical protein CFP56_024018 [Quercus suber]|uniref:Transmembrane protein n=1 Tax=Quercus suber TaxID=58331 RepID=A0AAW0K8S8_QUESU
MVGTDYGSWVVARGGGGWVAKMEFCIVAEEEKSGKWCSTFLNSQEIVDDWHASSLVLLFLLLVCIFLMSTLPLNKLELKLGIISSKKD